MYTVETNTELYNRLVPWGIATRGRSKKSNHARAVPENRETVRKVELCKIRAMTAAIDIDLDTIILIDN